MKLIVAVDEKWGIGKQGDLLMSIPDDMMFYRTTTRDKVVVMGYTTLLSLPGSKPAPGRLNIVLNNEEGCRVSGAVVCGSIDQMQRLVGDFDSGDVFVVGGASIYRQLLPYCDTAYITKMRFDGQADTFIPDLDALDNWSVFSESELKEYEGLGYSFVEYHNAAPVPIEYRSACSSMSSYFKKKPELELSLIDGAGEAYIKELSASLKAYFMPLADGFTAQDVTAYLESAGDESFERFLKQRGCIADAEDIAALTQKYDPEKRHQAYPVCISKENVQSFIDRLNTLSAFEMSQQFTDHPVSGCN